MSKPYTEQEIESGQITWPEWANYFVQDISGRQWFTECEPYSDYKGRARLTGFSINGGGRSACHCSGGIEKLIIIKREES